MTDDTARVDVEGGTPPTPSVPATQTEPRPEQPSEPPPAPPSSGPLWGAPPPSDPSGSAGKASRGPGRAAWIGGAILIVIGVVLLVREFVPQLAFGTIWPLLSVAFGVALVILSLRPARRT